MVKQARLLIGILPCCVDNHGNNAGIAHLLEHMAFKGTQRIGTKDYAAEAALLDALDGAFYALRDAQTSGTAMSDVVRLAREFQQLQVMSSRWYTHEHWSRSLCHRTITAM